jgi:hypothetical protein
MVYFISVTTCAVAREELSSPTTHHGGAGKDRRYRSYSFMTSAVDGVSGRHALAALYPRERIPGTHWTGGWVGPRAGLDTRGYRRNPFASAGDRTSTARSQPDTILTEYSDPLCCYYYYLFLIICVTYNETAENMTNVSSRHTLNRVWHTKVVK